MGSKKEKKNNNKTKKKKDNSVIPDTNDANVISDPRFSSLHTDPRFRDAPKHKTKVAIDSRFNRIFTHKSFLPSSAPVDKRGKPKNDTASRHGSLRHYYKMEEQEKEEEEEEKVKNQTQIEEEEEEETNDESGSEEEEVEHSSGDEDEDEILKVDRLKAESDEEEDEILKVDRLKAESDEEEESEEEEESGDEEESDSDTDTDTDEEEQESEEEAQEEVPNIEKETHRLAVVNMDWRYVKAVDLYVLLSSFAPSNGLIKSVAVYPSEFGIQRMKEEEVRGPVGLFDDENEESDEDSSDDEIDNEKLRAYEKSRMRYYYAVVECDSSTTADHIYKECDGLEFIQSSNALDLRFIPDDLEIKQPPRDVATEAPANYECKDFYSRALQHSKVNLSWDEDEPLRAKTLQRKFTDEQLDQLELKEFLTSDESESDDDDDDDNNETNDVPDKKALKREKYRALLQSGDGDGSDADSDHDGAQDMEVTFNTGLEDISKHIMEKKDKISETVWEAYLRKKREKKRARKNKSKYSSSSSDDNDDDSDTGPKSAEDADDFFVEEPAVKKRKKAESKHQDSDGIDQASKEELELLLADDKGTDTGVKGYNLKFKKGKGKKGENVIDEGKIPSSDFDDPRFASLLSPDFVIDPTDPQFKRSAVYARQLAQKQQMGHSEIPKETEYVKPSRGKQNEGEEEDALKSKKDKHELSYLVKSVKMKSKQVQLSSDGKTRKDGKSGFKGVGKKRH